MAADTVIPVNDLEDESSKYSNEEKLARCKLASLYRLVDLKGWTEEIYNHISLRAPGEEEHFLLNPFGMLYSEVTAANLVKVDLEGKVIDPGTTSLGVPLTGFVIHSAIHAVRKDIKCIIHVHTAAGTAISCLKCGLLPMTMDAVCAGGVSYHDFQGESTDTKERENLAADLGPVNKIMVLRNHGLLAMGSTVEEAFHYLISLMTACQSQLNAMSAVGGHLEKMTLLTDEQIKQVQNNPNSCYQADLLFESLMRKLDRKGYKTGYNYQIV